MIENMTIGELLRRKAVDYGYGSLAGMARAFETTSVTICRIARGEVKPGKRMRILIVQELDVAPEVLERVIGK